MKKKRMRVIVILLLLAVLLLAAGLFIVSYFKNGDGGFSGNTESAGDAEGSGDAEGNIVYEDEEQTTGYISDRLLLYVKAGVTQERVEEIAEELGGRVVEVYPSGYIYEIAVDSMSREELEAVCGRAQLYQEISSASVCTVNAVRINETDAELNIPNDPWRRWYNFSDKVDWDEDNPDGNNWWIEATRTLSAWQYADSFSRITVGVIDNGFDTDHRDLSITVLNDDQNSADVTGNVSGSTEGGKMVAPSPESARSPAVPADGGEAGGGTPADTARFCEQCGSPLEANARFCGRCGARIRRD